MTTACRFPNSARTRWLDRKARPRATARPRQDPEAKAARALAVAVAALLRQASLDQLRQVARILGKTDQWADLVCLEAKNPGVVGKAVLEAAR